MALYNRNIHVLTNIMVAVISFGIGTFWAGKRPELKNNASEDDLHTHLVHSIDKLEQDLDSSSHSTITPSVSPITVTDNTLDDPSDYYSTFNFQALASAIMLPQNYKI